MSDDELDKLAAEMQNMAPSETARKTGLEAAMAAFDMEFARDEVFEVSNVSAKEKPDDTQGLEGAARPMNKSAGIGPVQTIGTAAMSKLSQIFTFKPQSAMMMGSCAAALMAALVIFPMASDGILETMPPESLPPATTIVGNDVELVVTPPLTPAPDAATTDSHTDVTEIPETIETPTAPLQVPVAQVPPSVPPQKPLKTEPAPPVTQNPQAPQSLGTEDSVIVTGARVKRASNVITLERRVMKTPGSVQERVVPSVTKTQARRILKTPASTVERVVPPLTKQVERQVTGWDGSVETVTETVVVQPQSVEYDTVPAEYETVMETVAVQEASTELVTIPPVYETVRETIEIAADGSTQVLKSVTVTPPSAPIKDAGITSVNSLLSNVRTENIGQRTRQNLAEALQDISSASQTQAVQEYRAVLQQKDNIALFVSPQDAIRSSPAITKQVARRVIRTPASVQERIVPAITKEVSVEVKGDDGTVKTVTKTFVIQEARTEIVTTPPVYETVMETVVVQDAYREPPARDRFENYESNPVTPVKETPVSTFSIDVDTASYSFLRASLKGGKLPPPGAVRLEEMINYFPYDYKAPKSADEPFRANVTVTPTPWNADTKLMHIGIKGYVPSAKEKPRSNIVFLIDTSGSMRQPNKLPLLINSFKALLGTLDEEDTVSIVTYAGSAGTVLEPTSAHEKDKITAALNRLRAGGSTAGAAGLELAYNKAQESFDQDGVNRVILATDGDFNVGFSSPDEMKTFIEEKRKTGIFLSVLGFGMGNYNDQLMQSLAQNGNGVAAYIDSLEEANKVLANEAGSALFTIAKDVKIQVEFNPATVSEYRLIGYETRALKREDFNNDKVDAGEIGAGHSVTAFYELTPAGSKAQTIDDLRYASEDRKAAPSDELAFVKIRHKLPKSDTSTLQSFPVGRKQERRLKRASDDMRFAAAVAAAGQKLRGDVHLEDFSYDDVIKLASSAKGKDKKGYRAEFIELVHIISDLEGAQITDK